MKPKQPKAMVKAKQSKVMRELLKLDLGCGPRKREGYIGVDLHKFDGVDLVHDLRARWPWGDGTVSRINCSHFLEHLNQEERAHFVREAYRVLVPGTPGLVPIDHGMELVTPDIWSERSYGDPTHQWPPVCGMWFNYLDRTWRTTQAQHTDTPEWYHGVDFAISWGYSVRPELMQRDDEYRNYAITNYVNSRVDMIATWIKRT